MKKRELLTADEILRKLDSTVTMCTLIVAHDWGREILDFLDTQMCQEYEEVVKVATLNFLQDAKILRRPAHNELGELENE